MGDQAEFAWRSPEMLVEITLGSLMRGMLAEPPVARKPPRRR
jgi:hypothetical protein